MPNEQQELLPAREDVYASNTPALKFFLDVGDTNHYLSFENGVFHARSDADEGDVYTAMRKEYDRKGSALSRLCNRISLEKAKQLAEAALGAVKMPAAAQGALNTQQLHVAAGAVIQAERMQSLLQQGVETKIGQQPQDIGAGLSEQADPAKKASELPLATETVVQPQPAVVDKLPAADMSGFNFQQKITQTFTDPVTGEHKG